MGYLILQKLKENLFAVIADDTSYYVLLTLLLVCGGLAIYFGMRNFKRSLSAIQQAPTLRSKLDFYFEACMEKYKRFLLSGMLFSAGLYLTANDLFTLGYIAALALLSLGRPGLTAFFDDLQLSEEDKTILLEKRPIP